MDAATSVRRRRAEISRLTGQQRPAQTRSGEVIFLPRGIPGLITVPQRFRRGLHRIDPGV